MTGLHYAPGAGLLHRLDVRIKLVLLAVFSTAGLQLGREGLLLLGLPLLGFALMTGMLQRLRWQELKWLGMLLAFVWLARALSTQGAPVLAVGGIVISHEGVADGLQAGLRLVLIFLQGALFVSSTRPAEVKAGVQWFLKPLPFVPAERIGTMIGLIVRLIPLIFEEASRTLDAQRARGIENRRNPVYRMATFGIPLLRRVLGIADRLALAMEARCYTESRTGAELSAGSRDWAALAVGLTWLAVAMMV
jgi:energy-coupling factor transporter transmembrane protein EcfT